MLIRLRPSSAALLATTAFAASLAAATLAGPQQAAEAAHGDQSSTHTWTPGSFRTQVVIAGHYHTNNWACSLPAPVRCRKAGDVETVASDGRTGSGGCWDGVL